MPDHPFYGELHCYEKNNFEKMIPIYYIVDGKLNKGVIMKQYEVIRISGVAVGVGFIDHSGEAAYSEKICETLFDTGNDKKDASESEKWANLICSLLNNQLAQKRNK